LRMSYINICIAAILPSFFYYFSLYSSVHLGAVRRGLRPAPPAKEQFSPLWKILINNWHCIVSCGFLIVMLAIEAMTVRQNLMISTALLLVTGSIRKDTRPTFEALRRAVINTAKGLVEIGPVCAAAGIIIGCVSMTCLDYKFSAGITDIAGQNLFPLLLLATIACFILAMGMPTLPAYILVVMLVAPTLISLGIPPIAVHMFIFYQALAGMITPPICLNVYAVAPMVNSSIWQIGISAIVNGAARYVIPFFFIYRPGLLMIGSATDILVDIFLCFVVIIALSFAQSRYALIQAKWLEIFIALVGAFLLIEPLAGFPIPSQIIGAVLLVLALISQVVRFFRTRSSANDNVIAKKN